MKGRPVGLILVAGWLVPGGGHLLRHDYARAAVLFAAVGGLFMLGLLAGGATVLPDAGQLSGMDGTAALLARGGSLVKMLAGGPWLMARGLGYSQDFVAGQLYPYGSRLMVAAGLLNVLALAHLWESRGKGRS